MTRTDATTGRVDLLDIMIHVRRRRLDAVDEFNELHRDAMRQSVIDAFRKKHPSGVDADGQTAEQTFDARGAAMDYLMYLPFTPKDNVTSLDARLARLQVERELGHLYYLKALLTGRLDAEPSRDGYYTTPTKVGRPHYDSLKRMLTEEIACVKTGKMVSHDPSHLLASLDDLSAYVRTLYFERERSPEFILAEKDVTS